MSTEAPAAPATAAPAAPATAAPAAPAPAAPATAAEAAPAATAPTYAAFTLPPEVAFSETRLAEFTALAGASGLTQEQAQAFASFGATAVQATMADLDGHHQAEVAKWEAQTRADPVLAPELEKNLARAAEVAKTIPGLWEMLEATRFSSHPAMVHLLLSAAPGRLSDRNIGQAGAQQQPRGEPIDRLAKIYATQNKG